jgi:hypothetical protein
MSVHDDFIATIDALLALGKQEISSKEAVERLQTLDAQFFAQCQMLGFPLPEISKPTNEHLQLFGNSKIPYMAARRAEPGAPLYQKGQSVWHLFPTEEWVQAMLGLRALTDAHRRRAGGAASDPTSKRRQAREGNRGPHRKRGRPSDTDSKTDERVFQAWNTGRYRAYADLGRELGMDRKKVEKAIDRHRKRQQRQARRNNSPPTSTSSPLD